ncbi:hypothetical protein [Actinomycetospora sp. TBRC 11914]|uniref:hypothetical protein n=1 Tax=Actinomycetospora sp. TBRC 11914 TaxID=2729387 RepID=UPI00145CBF12|nr:hypothetical protein [Actinomycetospora sp. TBRC 11914]NMO88353.1 hypothetical protein [Actinomycetospora sp. TBRC 11914]
MPDPLTRDPDPPESDARPSSLGLARAEVSGPVLACALELIAAGHPLSLLPDAPTTEPAMDAEKGLRLWGYLGTLNARTAETVLTAATRSASGTYHLDIRGLDTFSLLAWPAIQRGTRDFRRHGGHLQVGVGEGTRELSRGFLGGLGFVDLELVLT